VQIPDLVSIRYCVHNSLPISTKFCTRLRNVVALTPIVCQQTGSSLPILKVCEFRFTFTFAICYRPSISLSSVCRLSSVTRAPYSDGCEFRQYFYGVWYPGHPLRCTENYMEIVPGEPLRRGVKPKRSSKI